MCKHVLNAQVAIRSPCCRKWFDCAECHAESEDHPLMQSFDMTFVCKKCRKAFRKDTKDWDDSDEYCPNCDNHFVIDALTPKAALKVESDDVRMDARMLKDERVKQSQEQSVFGVREAPTRLG